MTTQIDANRNFELSKIRQFFGCKMRGLAFEVTGGVLALTAGDAIAGFWGVDSSAGLYFGARLYTFALTNIEKEYFSSGLAVIGATISLVCGGLGAYETYKDIANPDQVAERSATRGAIQDILNGNKSSTHSADIIDWAPFGQKGRKLGEISVTGDDQGPTIVDERHEDDDGSVSWSQAKCEAITISRSSGPSYQTAVRRSPLESFVYC